MSQININGPDDDPGDRTAAAGINLIAVIIVLLVVLALVWFLFSGPLHVFGGGTTINVNPPAQSNPANPPAQNNPAYPPAQNPANPPAQPAPGGGGTAP